MIYIPADAVILICDFSLLLLLAFCRLWVAWPKPISRERMEFLKGRDGR